MNGQGAYTYEDNTLIRLPNTSVIKINTAIRAYNEHKKYSEKYP